MILMVIVIIMMTHPGFMRQLFVQVLLKSPVEFAIGVGNDNFVGVEFSWTMTQFSGAEKHVPQGL